MTLSKGEDGRKARHEDEEVEAPKRGKSLRAALDEFRVDHRLVVTARAAQLFDYLAKHAPYQLCPPNLALKAIMGFAKTPRENGEDVMRFRARSTQIRKTLADVYGRGFLIEKPYSYMRATVDDEDLARTQQAREVDRIRSAVTSAKRTNALIAVSKVRDPAVRAWLKGGVSPLLKALTEDDRIFRLAPKKEEK